MHVMYLAGGGPVTTVFRGVKRKDRRHVSCAYF